MTVAEVWTSCGCVSTQTVPLRIGPGERRGVPFRLSSTPASGSSSYRVEFRDESGSVLAATTVRICRQLGLLACPLVLRPELRSLPRQRFVADLVLTGADLLELSTLQPLFRGDGYRAVAFRERGIAALSDGRYARFLGIEGELAADYGGWRGQSIALLSSSDGRVVLEVPLSPRGATSSDLQFGAKISEQ